MWHPFKKKTKYPPQQLSEKQIKLIEYVDQELINMHGPVQHDERYGPEIRFTGVIYTRTFYPFSKMIEGISLKPGEYYMPNSVAFVAQNNGDWVLYYLVKTDTPSSPEYITLFNDALGRTNKARALDFELKKSRDNPEQN